MINNNKDIKPFYIYSDKNCLYIKNINEQTEKLANNIFSYSANIDDNKNIHICALDTKGRLLHFINNKTWKKTVIHKVINNVKNVKEMRLYIVNNYFNIFIVENSSLSDNLYRVSHFNFKASNYKISKYTFNNILKDNESIYKLNIDDLSNIIFEYNKFNPSTRNSLKNNFIFNSNNREWVNVDSISKINNNIASSNNKSNIKDDIFEYCYSIKYKF